MTEGKYPALSTAAGLLELIVDEWDCLVADFRRFYGMDLAVACWGGPDRHGIGLRDLAALVKGLPADSALAVEKGWSWTARDQMIADIRELTHQGAWASLQTMGATYGAAGAGRKIPKPPKALPVPRPSQLDPPKPPGPKSVREVVAMFSSVGALAPKVR